MRILVTGGLGFIGSNFIRMMLRKYPDYEVVNLDKQTYAGNPDNLRDVEKDKRYNFVKGDICDPNTVARVMKGCDFVVNFAAETHVDRSIGRPDDFIKTDVYGTYNLLEHAKRFGVKRFLQISTDEVYGSIKHGKFKETDMLKPSSPYAASKAGGDMVALSYYTTYKVPVLITRSSNNFGPYQYPEKLIPLFITNLIEGKKVPVYGDGKNIRDWIYVLDNCLGIDFVLHKGNLGEIYNIGGGNENTNMWITKQLLKETGRDEGFIEFVKDRPGHDRRYALNCKKARKLGWKPRFKFHKALKDTAEWYKANEWLWGKIKSGEYMNYYREMYGKKYGMKSL